MSRSPRRGHGTRSRARFMRTVLIRRLASGHSETRSSRRAECDFRGPELFYGSDCLFPVSAANL